MEAQLQRPVTVTQIGVDVLEGLWLHRLLSTSQVHELYFPGKTKRWAKQVLDELAGWGLVSAVQGRERGGPYYWYLTAAGGSAVATISDNVTGTAPSIEQVASVLQAHTRALNDCGIAFVKSAREHDDDCVPLSWEHEVVHKMGSQVGQTFRCDGLLRYGIIRDKGAAQRHYFVELDRCNESMDTLVGKLRRYAEYRAWVDPDVLPGTTPGGLESWRRRYPAFPRLVFVFAPSSKMFDPKAVRKRALRTMHMAVADPIIRHTLGSVTDFHVSACLLDDLMSKGIYEPVFYEIGNKTDGDGESEYFVKSDPVNILGQDRYDLKPGKLV